MASEFAMQTVGMKNVHSFALAQNRTKPCIFGRVGHSTVYPPPQPFNIGLNGVEAESGGLSRGLDTFFNKLKKEVYNG